MEHYLHFLCINLIASMISLSDYMEAGLNGSAALEGVLINNHCPDLNGLGARCVGCSTEKGRKRESR